jgi:hypothetical protein
MNDLKQEALVNMARELKKSSPSHWTSDPLSAETVIRLIDIAYSGTPYQVREVHAEAGLYLADRTHCIERVMKLS